MEKIGFLERYAKLADTTLRIEQERYSDSYRAIILPNYLSEFFFDNLSGDDKDSAETQYFFGENSLFPSADGDTIGQSLRRLSAKLEVMYTLHDNPTLPSRLNIIPNFSLFKTVEYDNERPVIHIVSFEDVVEDMMRGGDGLYWYSELKTKASQKTYPNLYALLNVELTDAIKHGLDSACRLS